MNNLLQSKKNKAIAHFNQGRFAEAEKLIKQVCQKARQDAESWYLLGSISANQGLHYQASEAFEKVLKIAAGNKFMRDAAVNLGVSLSAQKKYERSRTILEQVIAKYPDEADAYINLVTSCMLLKDNDKAFEYAQQAIKLAPEQPMAYQNYGSVCSMMKKYDLAEEAFEKAIRLDRQVPEYYMSYARMLGFARYYERGIEMCKTVLGMSAGHTIAINTKLSYQVAQGDIAIALEEHIKLLNEGVLKRHEATGYLLYTQYSNQMTNEQLMDAHVQWGKAFKVIQNPKPYAFKKEHKSTLNIAYLSPDFRGHSVAYFMESILEHHDRDKVAVTCFAHLNEEDKTTEKFRQLSDHWHDITLLSNAELADLIRAKNIDVLIELAGHTRDSRLRVMVDRVAPIQISYLGYPSTTGLPGVDYRFVDFYTDPEGYDQFATEELVRIPECFLCYTNDAIEIPEIRQTENGKLEHKTITFGSFNNLSKVNAQVVELWSKLLLQVLGSRLLMKNLSFDDAVVRERYMALFKSNGIDAARIQLVGMIKDTKKHMNLYSEVDIALDTFPYNGTTTTCEAMWMGVPVVTLCGNRHSARVGTSLLNSIGASEWVAHSDENYISIAADLASDKNKLSEIKAGLRQKMQQSVLCDGPAFVNKLETIYDDLYQKWCDKD